MKNAQGVAKVEKRREDARALRKLSRKKKMPTKHTRAS